MSHHWLDPPISACILHQPSLVVWRQNKAWCTVIVSIGRTEKKGKEETARGRDEREMERVRNIVVFPPQLNCLSNPSQRVTQFICLKSIRPSQCESLSQHETGPLIILFSVLSLSCSRLSLIFSYFKSIIIFYHARRCLSERDVLFIQCCRVSLSLCLCSNQWETQNE